MGRGNLYACALTLLLLSFHTVFGLSDISKPRLPEKFTEFVQAVHDGETIISRAREKTLYRSNVRKEQAEQNVCVALYMAHDESFFLDEWVGYHSLLGVSHVFICNDLRDRTKTENFTNFAEPFVAKGFISHVDWALHDGLTHSLTKELSLSAQKRCLTFAIELSKLKGSVLEFCDWLALIDIDEFITITPPCDTQEKCMHSLTPALPSLLASQAKDTGCVKFRWGVFGDSGRVKHPVSASVLSSYTLRSKVTERQIWKKPICRKEAFHIDGLLALHSPPMRPGYREQVLPWSDARISHYPIRSFVMFMATRMQDHEGSSRVPGDLMALYISGNALANQEEDYTLANLANVIGNELTGRFQLDLWKRFRKRSRIYNSLVDEFDNSQILLDSSRESRGEHFVKLSRLTQRNVKNRHNFPRPSRLGQLAAKHRHRS